MISRDSQCLKITENVSFHNVSAVNYVYILSGRQKFIKNVKNGPFWRVWKNSKEIQLRHFWVILRHCGAKESDAFRENNHC